MSTPYEENGRSAQKKRTRDALVAAARELIAAGSTPSVEAAAAEASISRTTAYRYFPNQRALLIAAHPEVVAASMLPEEPPADPRQRLDAAVENFLAMIVDTEAQQRSTLRLALEATPEERAQLPLRQGRAIGWFAEALEPLRGRLAAEELHRLVLAIRASAGIEALVWLTDVGGLDRTEAVELMRWSARALLDHVSGEPPPVRGPARSSRRRHGDEPIEHSYDLPKSGGLAG
jgi:AcrR family transcriptional regulator